MIEAGKDPDSGVSQIEVAAEQESGFSDTRIGRVRWTICAMLFFATSINYMDRHNYRQCMPHNADPAIEALPSLDFSSGYVQRAVAKMPKQGSKRPWRLYQNYALDIVTLRFGKVDDGVMQYSCSLAEDRCA